MLVVLLAGGLVIVLVSFVMPMHCFGAISKRPYRGCRKGVYGLLGGCKHHGRRPVLRLMAQLGGRRLPDRRVCSKCGSPTTFCRLQRDGKPFLGCTSYPTCKNPRFLNTYSF